MANTNPKMFVNFTGSKATFISKGYPTTYANSIVFISGDANGATAEDKSSCIFAKGKYFANTVEAEKYLATLPYFKGIKVGNNTYNAANGGGYLALAANDPATLTINTNSDGVIIGLTDAVKNTIAGAVQTVTGDDYVKATKSGTTITLETQVETALATSASDKKVPTAKAVKDYTLAARDSVVGTSGDKKDANTVYGAKAYADDAINTLTTNVITPVSDRVKTIEDTYATKTYADGAVNTFKTSLAEELSVTDTNNFVTVGLKQTDGKINSLTVSTENIAKSSEVGTVGQLATTKKTVVEAINEVLAAVGTGGTNAVVTLEKSADGLTYVLKQGGVVVETISIPKDMVVESGKYENGNLILTIANGGGTVTIPVSDLIDTYTPDNTDKNVTVAISDYKVSASINAGGVGTTELAANAVTTAKIADNNVTTAKILDSNVTTAKLADKAVTSAKIAFGAVGADQLSDEVTTILGRVGSKAVSAQISDAVNALDSNATSTDGTNVAVKVTQTDGKITAVNITKDDTLKEVEGSTYVSASSKASAKQTISVTVKPVLGDGVATAAGQGLADAYAVNQALGETYVDAVEDAKLYTDTALAWEELS